MIELKNVTKVYDGNVTGVDNLNLRIEDGEFVFIVGESGSGKSTLLKLLMRELTPNEGEIIIDGKDITKLRRKKVAELRRKMGIVFQDYRLLPDLNVYDNVAFAQHVVGRSPGFIRRRVPETLREVGLAEKYKSFPRQLYIHRNTLVYRLDKLQKNTGLDVRTFDDAITFKIALMVAKYMNYMEKNGFR